MAWARSGAPAGSLVVATEQVSARARPRRPWPPGGDNGVSFTLVLRPQLPPVRGGILYVAATAGITDVLGAGSSIDWPDEVVLGDRLAGLVSVHLELTVRGLEWALVNVQLLQLALPLPVHLAAVVAAIEGRVRQPAEQLIDEWTPRCRTIGRTVSGLLYPIGRGQRVSGLASRVRSSGALIVDDSTGRPQGIRPHELATWET